MRAGRTRVRRVSSRLVVLASAAALAVGVVACGEEEQPAGGGGQAAEGNGERVTVGLITKRDTNPFFVKMKEAAQAKAQEQNVELLTAAGRSDVDNQSQVTALENMTTRGAKG